MSRKTTGGGQLIPEMLVLVSMVSSSVEVDALHGVPRGNPVMPGGGPVVRASRVWHTGGSSGRKAEGWLKGDPTPVPRPDLVLDDGLAPDQPEAFGRVSGHDSLQSRGDVFGPASCPLTRLICSCPLGRRRRYPDTGSGVVLELNLQQ